ncbi:hypothetical protein GTA08_BOTSDO11464 [Neofusicoccum parvum]|nr:hypothetical protein GTA08_BOTSDO11464 [Neofusicoccum parvum]
MARILRPPIVQSGIFHLAGYSLALVGRLRLVHIIVWAVLAAILFAATGALRSEFYKKKIPVFGAWELLDLKDGKLEVPTHLRPHQPVRIAKANRFDDRYEFLHPIGRGAEGTAALYRDLFTNSVVVVKSFWRRSHPIMPIMPEAWSEYFYHQLDVWPAEIPATLLLAGLEPAHHGTSNLTHQYQAFRHGLVPALDYFIALTPIHPLLPSWTIPTWTLVTPFIPAGDLTALALTLHRSPTCHSPASLDATFRPALYGLLSHLAGLHGRGYCHNDMQAANVFVAGPAAWLLGDLGHARGPDHPYLRTRHWAGNGHWPDCRLDDVRRALKTYLAFLRAAAADPAAFDDALYAEREAWSRLYWGWLRRPAGAEALLGDRGRYLPERGGEGRGEGRERGWREEMLAAAVSRELAGRDVRVWRSWRWWWALEGPWQRFRYERNLRDGERA